MAAVAKISRRESETNPAAEKDRGSGVRETPLFKALPWLKVIPCGGRQ